MIQKLSVRDVDLKQKKVLIRVDFNVPIENGVITDDTRIVASIPTIQYVLDQGGAVILMSHLGRPNGKPDPRFTLAPCAKRLEELLHKPVKMASDCIGSHTLELARSLKSGEILLLENLRFHPGEEKPEAESGFADALAELGDVYIDDAFGSAHRPHASICTITQFFSGKSAAGFLLEKEIDYLGSKLKHPAPPFCVVLGGAKVSTKFQCIQALMKKADTLLIGGAMANTFLKAMDISLGDSFYEPDFVRVAEQLLSVGAQSKSTIILPVDLVVATSIDPQAKTRIVSVADGIPDGYQALDIGPKTIELFISELDKASTIFWNGPLGVFECAPFANGSYKIAQAIADSSAVTIAGGGDTIAVLEKVQVMDRLNHVSTGGGASLEYIELGTLPGIEVLSNKEGGK